MDVGDGSFRFGRGRTNFRWRQMFVPIHVKMYLRFFCYCHGLHFLTFCIFERFYRENVIKTLVQMLLKMIFCIIFYVVKNAAW